MYSLLAITLPEQEHPVLLEHASDYVSFYFHCAHTDRCFDGTIFLSWAQGLAQLRVCRSPSSQA